MLAFINNFVKEEALRHLQEDKQEAEAQSNGPKEINKLEENKQEAKQQENISKPEENKQEAETGIRQLDDLNACHIVLSQLQEKEESHLITKNTQKEKKKKKHRKKDKKRKTSKLRKSLLQEKDLMRYMEMLSILYASNK